jgi:hypothetical protein
MGLIYSFCEYFTNGINVLLKGERNFLMIRDLGDSYRMISPKPFTLCFRNVLLFHARDFVSTSDLRMLRACVYCTTFFKKVQFTLDSAHSRQQSKTKRAALSSQLFEVLTSQGQNKFDHVITNDKSWFYFEYLHAVVWTSSRDEVRERIKQRNDIEKCLILIICLSTEFTVYWIYPKILHRIVHYFVILLCSILLKISAHIAGKRPWNVS